MTNLGLLGYPQGVSPSVDLLNHVTLGPRYREPSRRINWPSAIGGLVANNSEAVFYDLTPLGAGVPCALEWDVMLRAGVWSAVLTYLQSTQYGISQLWLDGQSLGTYDAYTAGANNSGIFYSGVNIPIAEGQHTVRLGKTGTKNASSTDYYTGFYSITLRRVTAY